MMYIYNNFEKQVGTLDVDYVFTDEIGKISTLEFTTSIEIEKNSRIVTKINNKFYEFIIVDVDYSRGNKYEFDYYCQNSIIELQGYIVKEKRPTLDIKGGMDVILEETRWTSTVIGYDLSIKKKLNLYRQTILSAFKEVVELFGVEWDVRIQVSKDKVISREIVVEKQGKKANGRLEFGKNIINFQRRILSDPIITALVGLGKGEANFDESGEVTGWGRRITFADVNNGIWYITNEDARELYGIGEEGNKKHFFGFVEFGECEDKQELLELSREYLKTASRINAEYSINVANIGIDIQKGDEVAAVDEVINFRGYIRVIGIKRTKVSTELTLGTKTGTFTTKTNRVVSTINNVVTEQVGSAVDYTLKNITQKYISEDAYTYNLDVGNPHNLPAGIYSFNKPINENPDTVIYIGAGKVLIANERGTDGAWIWKTAMTGEGVVGDSIITKSITVNQLASDVGQSLDISSNEAIIATVKKDNYDSDIEIINNNYTSLKQSTEEFEFKFVTQNDFDDEQKVNNERQETLEKYIRFIDGKIVLGEEGNELELKLENKKIVFLDKGKEVAYFTNNQLFVDDIQVVTRMQIAQSEFRMITDNIAGIGVIK
ncbi:MAG: phage tail protein [Tissierellia bacterium]|nr:phage tail protein [Tissierellia bacterium]